MKKSLTILTLLLLTVQFVLAQVSSEERSALLDLYSSTQGEQWLKPWNPELPVSKWQGVTVEKGHVVEINLFRNNLDGSLPKTMWRARTRPSGGSTPAMRISRRTWLSRKKSRWPTPPVHCPTT